MNKLSLIKKISAAGLASTLSLLSYAACMVLVLNVPALLSGCKSLNVSGTNAVVRVQAITELSAYTTAKLALMKNPTNRVVLAKVQAGTAELVRASTWDLSTLASIATANGLSDLVSSEGQLILAGAPLLLDLFYGNRIDLKSSAYAEAVVRGVDGGLAKALSVTPAARTMALSRDATLLELEQAARRTR